MIDERKTKERLIALPVKLSLRHKIIKALENNRCGGIETVHRKKKRSKRQQQT